MNVYKRKKRFFLNIKGKINFRIERILYYLYCFRYKGVQIMIARCADKDSEKLSIPFKKAIIPYIFMSRKKIQEKYWEYYK